LYESIKAKLVFGENIAQTLQFVQSGNAQIGIVAHSLAVAPSVRGKGRFWEVPADKHPRIDQGGVILKWARNAEAARKFCSYLNGPTGRATLKQYGLALPGE
jgi:molybdate transport system substrate-binding protein